MVPLRRHARGRADSGDSKSMYSSLFLEVNARLRTYSGQLATQYSLVLTAVLGHVWLQGVGRKVLASHFLVPPLVVPSIAAYLFVPHS